MDGTPVHHYQLIGPGVSLPPAGDLQLLLQESCEDSSTFHEFLLANGLFLVPLACSSHRLHISLKFFLHKDAERL